MKFSSRGFTVIEILMAIVLLGILTSVTITLVGGSVDSGRYEQTRVQMEVIRTAIVGDASVENNGQRTHFGYFGDRGAMPGALTNLTVAEAPAWAFNSTYGVGVGWKGPYVEASFAASSVTKDAWGNDFVYSPAANPPTLTSYGANGVAGGTSYNQDLVIQFPATSRLANVRGIVSSTVARIAGVTVEIRYPVNGVLTAFTNVTDANGAFSFANVPFGVRAISVTTVPALGPKQIVVDSPNYEVPTTALNYYNGSVNYMNGTAVLSGPSTSYVTATLQSTYNVVKQEAFLTLSWTGGGYLTSVIVNGVSQATANLVSGTRFAVAANHTYQPLTNNNSFEARFSANSNGTGSQNMTGQTITVLFEWVGGGAMDTATFP